MIILSILSWCPRQPLTAFRNAASHIWTHKHKTNIATQKQLPSSKIDAHRRPQHCSGLTGASDDNWRAITYQLNLQLYLIISVIRVRDIICTCMRKQKCMHTWPSPEVSSVHHTTASVWRNTASSCQTWRTVVNHLTSVCVPFSSLEYRRSMSRRLRQQVIVMVKL